MTPFGRAWLPKWGLDPSITYLNHGTVGAPPLAVLARQREILEEIERQPSRFLLRELSEIKVGGPRRMPPRMRTAATAVARHFGAQGEDVVFVDNATTGANAVLRSLPFSAGDQLLVTRLGYGGVTNAARYVARERGAELVAVELPASLSDPGLAIERIAAALTDRTRLAVIDHIASDSALLLPVREIAARCRERGVPILVDGAHAPGSIALDIPAIGCDWYVANLHKWGWAPRSSGILWAAPHRQAGLHPAVISWGLDEGFTTEFDLVGTRDPSPWLASPAGLELQEEIGAESIRRYNHETAVAAGERLADRWGVPFVTPRSMIASMVSLALPASFGSTREDAARLRDQLLFEDGIEVGMSANEGAVRLRLAIQIYNDFDDVDRLGEAIERRMR